MYFLCRVNLEIYSMAITAESKTGNTVQDLNGRIHRTHRKKHSIYNSLAMANSELQYLKSGRYAA
jgi:hypothetical protein